MTEKFIKYMTESKDISRIFMGKANDAMARFLTGVEDQIDRDYFEKDKKKHKKFNSAMTEIDKDWEILWDKIVKLVKVI